MGVGLPFNQAHPLSIKKGGTVGTRSSRIIFLGSAYLLLGLVALAFTTVTTMASMMILGIVLFCAGIVQIVYGIQGRKTGQLWPHVGLGCLALVCSGLIVINPVGNVLAFTLLIGFLLLASGLTKIIGAFSERSTGWGWFALNGGLSILLGALVIGTFPYSAFWAIGTFVGVDLILAGATMIGLGVSVKRAKRELVGDHQSLFPDSHDEEYAKRSTSPTGRNTPPPPLH
ncbi:acid-resistance membrane protein [compost metagenome]